MVRNVENKCKTKYPVLLVHGAGSRDRKHLNCWGRIPGSLQDEGAVLYYGCQDGWGTIEHNAQMLKQKIESILKEAESEKINVIAHSKGGLETRYLISSLGMDNIIASLTTIGTPHRGVRVMDSLLKTPRFLFKSLAFIVNLFSKLSGDTNPDFYYACVQLTQRHAVRFNEQNPDSDAVYYQSYAAVMKSSFSDFLLLLPHFIIQLSEGDNDGLVPVSSAQWTNFKGILTGATRRGVSHADEVDFRRMDLTKKKGLEGVSDIRDVYIGILCDLKRQGM